MVAHRSARHRALVAGLGLLCGALACGGRAGSTPENAARAFLEAAGDGQTEALFALLAPTSRTMLQRLARRATLQAGGQRRLKAEDLLVLGFARPRFEASDVELSYADRDRAQVRLISRADHGSELLDLQRVDGHWRVVLPQPASDLFR